jgi:DME family drug/metabolite transporter
LRVNWPAPTIVLAEHTLLVLVLLPFLPKALRAFGRLDTGGKVAVVTIGAGASAVATTCSLCLSSSATQ